MTYLDVLLGRKILMLAQAIGPNEVATLVQNTKLAVLT